MKRRLQAIVDVHLIIDDERVCGIIDGAKMVHELQIMPYILSDICTHCLCHLLCGFKATDKLN